MVKIGEEGKSGPLVSSSSMASPPCIQVSAGCRSSLQLCWHSLLLGHARDPSGYPQNSSGFTNTTHKTWVWLQSLLCGLPDVTSLQEGGDQSVATRYWCNWAVGELGQL